MNKIVIKTRTQDNGHLLLDIPTELQNSDIDVTIFLEPASISSFQSIKNWPDDYFQKTSGVLANDPIQRYPQGDLYLRESIR